MQSYLESPGWPLLNSGSALLGHLSEITTLADTSTRRVCYHPEGNTTPTGPEGRTGCFNRGSENENACCGRCVLAASSNIRYILRSISALREPRYVARMSPDDCTPPPMAISAHVLAMRFLRILIDACNCLPLPLLVCSVVRT